jgi:hypothetical protein
VHWFPPEIASIASEFFYRFITGDLTLVHDLVERHKAAKVLATVTTAGPDIDGAGGNEESPW